MKSFFLKLRRKSGRFPINWALWLAVFCFIALVNFIFVRAAYPAGQPWYRLYRFSAWWGNTAWIVCILSGFVGFSHLLRSRVHTHAATALEVFGVCAGFFYLLDYFYYGIQHMHLNYAGAVIFEGGPGRVYYNLRVTGTSAAMAIAHLLLLPVMGVAGFGASRLTTRMMEDRKWRISRFDLMSIAFAGFALFFVEQGLSPFWKDPARWAYEQETFPLPLRVFNAQKAAYLAEIPIQIKPFASKPVPRTKKTQALSGPPLHLFLVVLESFRADVVTPEITPHLSELAREGRSLSTAYANANATHNAWWSIFHAQYPQTWDAYRRQRPLPGSPVLQIFKDAGYKIRVFCQPIINLMYFDFGRLVYGQNYGLVDQLVRSDTALSSPYSDRALLGELKKELIGGDWNTPSFNVLYLDGAHFNYSWPEDAKPLYTPHADDIGLATLVLAPTPELLFRRYKNAVHSVDTSVGEMIAAIKARGLYDQMAIAVVGDHGEEFREHGGYLHSSALFEEQVRIPLIFKLPAGRGLSWPDSLGLGSQIHVLPTLLDVAGLYSGNTSQFEGRSYLRGDPSHRFALTAAVYLTQSPYQYSLFNGEQKLLFDLDRDSADTSRVLYVRGITSQRDEAWVPGTGSPQDYLQAVQERFLPHLKRLDFLSDIKLSTTAKK